MGEARLPRFDRWFCMLTICRSDARELDMRGVSVVDRGPLDGVLQKLVGEGGVGGDGGTSSYIESASPLSYMTLGVLATAAWEGV
jgi:hypothetical protein